MISLGFVLMGFGITVPAVYWVIAVLLLIIGFIVLSVTQPGTCVLLDLQGFSTLLTVILLEFIFPQFALTWWMWLYFIVTGILSLFVSIANN